MPSKFYPVDISALRQLLDERVKDWHPFSLATIIQAALDMAFAHDAAEWHERARQIHDRKHQTAVFNGKNYGRKEK